VRAGGQLTDQTWRSPNGLGRYVVISGNLAEQAVNPSAENWLNSRIKLPIPGQIPTTLNNC
jgi:hypothetical protein